MPPANDNLANATTLVNGLSTYGVTTVGATSEGDAGFGAEDTFWGYYNTVWYHGIMSDDATITFSATNANYGYYAELYRSPTALGSPGEVFDNGIFMDNIGNALGTDDSDTTASIAAGQHIYIVATSWSFTEGDTGSFSMTVTLPVALTCLTATDYINGSSATASIVSGSVRETQWYKSARGNPYMAALSDQVATLVIPGSDICGSSAGFYRVRISSKNSVDVPGNYFFAGFIRNGQPLYPVTNIVTTTGATAVDDWITIASNIDITEETPTLSSNSGFAQSLDCLHYLPVHPDDTIEVIVTGPFDATPTFSTDITRICFARMLDASPDPPYSVLDVPDFPLGTVIGDMNTDEQAGDLCPYKATVPTYGVHDIDGMDMVVTNDGTIWVAANIEAATTAGARIIGPILQKWTGSSWTLVRDDIEGLGVKRTTRDGVNFFAEGFRGVSLATDGTDLYIAYGIDDGAWPGTGGFRNTVIRVKKYVPGTDTLSSVGSPVYANTTRVNIRSEAGGFDCSAAMAVSPNGTPWVAFSDYIDADVAHACARAAYAAKWNGSSWVVYAMPPPTPVASYTSGQNITEAETIITGSPTVSSVTEDGETAVRDTQTAYTNKSVSFIPPAGNWGYRVRYEFNRPSGIGGIKVKGYKNGTAIQSSFADDFTASSATNPTWAWSTPIQAYQTFNGTSDTLEIAIACTGTANEVFIDKVQLVPAKEVIGTISWDTIFVTETSQYGVQIAFPDGENPVGIHQAFAPRADLDSGSDFYSPPGQYLGADFESAQWWTYCRFDGSEFDLLWSNLFEEFAPGQISEKTLSYPYGFQRITGHWQQGYTLYTDETDVYLTANLGIAISGGSETICVKLTDIGMDEFADKPIGLMGGSGDSTAAFGWIQWANILHSNGMVMTPYGLFVGINITGQMQQMEDTVATPVANGIGGWFIAADNNLPIGQNNIEGGTPVLAKSPNGLTVYILTDAFIWFDPDGDQEPTTFGVWECPVLVDQHVPLVPLTGMVARVYPDGRIEILSKPNQRVRVDPDGKVNILGTQTPRNVTVGIDGTVRVS